MLPKMRYRLALDLGSASLGWAMVRLDASGNPCALIKAGVRIFSNGRQPAKKGELGTSWAAHRREKRTLRRRRDRLLRRKNLMKSLLIKHGFFPVDEAARKALKPRNPYTLRAKGLDRKLTPAEFARALFHINQRRGFKSNQKTDRSSKPDEKKKASEMQNAINTLRSQLDPEGTGGKARTVGELLWRRMQAGQEVRARNKSAQSQHGAARPLHRPRHDRGRV